MAVLLLVGGVLILARESKTGYSVWEEINYRTAGELIRYALERLEGHPTLEQIAHPVLHAAQRRIERPVVTPRSLIDTMGKGQQGFVLPPKPTMKPDSPSRLKCSTCAVKRMRYLRHRCWAQHMPCTMRLSLRLPRRARALVM